MFIGAHNHPCDAKWEREIFAAIGRTDETAQRFVNGLCVSLIRYVVARDEHANRILAKEFERRCEPLIKALERVLVEIEYFKGDIKTGRGGSEHFFDGICRAKQAGLTDKTGRNFIEEIDNNLIALRNALEYGKEESAKASHGKEKPFRWTFAEETADLFGEVLGEKPTGYSRVNEPKNKFSSTTTDNGVSGRYAKVVKICLEAVNDSQNLDDLVKHGKSHFKRKHP